MKVTPRIRPDLEASPVEEQGIKYFDVKDPRSGNKLRLYDFEWLIAAKLDGQKPFDELAAWAKSLGIAPSADDLSAYADKLRGLGFFDEASPQNGASAAAADAGEEVRMEVDEEPEISTEEPTLEVQRKNPSNVASVDSMRATDAAMPTTPAPAPPPREEPRAQPAPRRDAAPPVREPEPAGGPSGSLIAILAVVALGVVGALYFKFLAAAPVAVKVQVAAPQEVMKLYDGQGAVKKSEAQTLSFGENGTVAEVVAKGTVLKPGDVVASLDGAAKLEKELADVKDRLGYYQKKLEAAKAKGADGESAAKEAEGKVAEKQKLANDVEAKLAKTKLTAPAGGTVSDVMAQQGAEVKAGAPVVKVGDKRMVVELKLPAAEAATLKVGAGVTLQNGKNQAAPGRVASVADGAVTIELVDESLKDGETVRLVKSRVANVIKLPPAAVTKEGGADVVYVLHQGEAKQRKVNVADRTASEVLVSGGLAAGEQVIVNTPAPLTDGAKAVSQ